MLIGLKEFSPGFDPVSCLDRVSRTDPLLCELDLLPFIEPYKLLHFPLGCGDIPCIILKVCFSCGDIAIAGTTHGDIHPVKELSCDIPHEITGSSMLFAPVGILMSSVGIVKCIGSFGEPCHSLHQRCGIGDGLFCQVLYLHDGTP